MSQDDVPTVDPDNEKGKLEIGWIVVIAIIAMALAFGALKLTGRTVPPQTGVVGPNRAEPTALVPNATEKTVVPAH